MHVRRGLEVKEEPIDRPIDDLSPDELPDRMIRHLISDEDVDKSSGLRIANRRQAKGIVFEPHQIPGIAAACHAEITAG
jgi:hypothetical protein